MIVSNSASSQEMQTYQKSLAANGYNVSMQQDDTLAVQDPVWISSGNRRRVEYQTVTLKDSRQVVRFLLQRGY